MSSLRGWRDFLKSSWGFHVFLGVICTFSVRKFVSLVMLGPVTFVTLQLFAVHTTRKLSRFQMRTIV